MANKEFWTQVIEKANNDDEQKRLLAEMLAEYDQAKQLLNEAGYSWTGFSMLESVRYLLNER